MEYIHNNVLSRAINFGRQCHFKIWLDCHKFKKIPYLIMPTSTKCQKIEKKMTMSYNVMIGYDIYDCFTMEHFRLCQRMTLTIKIYCSRLYKRQRSNILLKLINENYVLSDFLTMSWCIYEYYTKLFQENVKKNKLIKFDNCQETIAMLILKFKCLSVANTKNVPNTNY
jgi:hypothetical protein